MREKLHQAKKRGFHAIWRSDVAGRRSPASAPSIAGLVRPFSSFDMPTADAGLDGAGSIARCGDVLHRRAHVSVPRLLQHRHGRARRRAEDRGDTRQDGHALGEADAR